MSITVSVNKVDKKVEKSTTLASLQKQLDLPIKGCVFVINEQIIPKGLWPTTTLNEGDQISLFQAIAGG